MTPGERAPRRVFLTGFMGVGKTTVGRDLADLLRVPFLDVDSEIEARTGMEVREIFASRGEAAFRRMEREVLATTLEHPELVVATGGGTVTTEDSARLIREGGVSVWLDLPFPDLLSRVGAAGRELRPLFRDEARALDLYRRRLPTYRRADLRVGVAPEESPAEVAARIARLLREHRCDT